MPQGTYDDPEYAARKARELAHEHALLERANYLANALIDVCMELGWGGDNPIENAQDRVEKVGVARGLQVREPSPLTKPARKPLSRSLVREVWDRDGWRCVTCGTNTDLTVDHIQPVSKGGTNDLDNLQTMCRTCNIRKGART